MKIYRHDLEKETTLSMDEKGNWVDLPEDGAKDPEIPVVNVETSRDGEEIMVLLSSGIYFVVEKEEMEKMIVKSWKERGLVLLGGEREG